MERADFEELSDAEAEAGLAEDTEAGEAKCLTCHLDARDCACRVDAIVSLAPDALKDKARETLRTTAVEQQQDGEGVHASLRSPTSQDQQDAERVANRDAAGRFGAGNTIGAQYPPGTTGNPDGAPKHKVELTRMLSERLEQTGEDGRTWAQRVTDKLVAMADAGNMEAVKYLVDRIEGKPAQAVSLTLDDAPIHYRLAVIDGGPRRSALEPGDTDA